MDRLSDDLICYIIEFIKECESVRNLLLISKNINNCVHKSIIQSPVVIDELMKLEYRHFKRIKCVIINKDVSDIQLLPFINHYCNKIETLIFEYDFHIFNNSFFSKLTKLKKLEFKKNIKFLGTENIEKLYDDLIGITTLKYLQMPLIPNTHLSKLDGIEEFYVMF
jgi:hypothetical protein